MLKYLYVLWVIFLILFAAILLCSLVFLDYYYTIADLDSLLFYLRTMSLSDNTMATQSGIFFIFSICMIFIIVFYLLTIVWLKCRLWVFVFLYAPILYYLNVRYMLYDYIKTFWNDDKDYYAEHYVAPEKVSIKFPENKKNLIILYLESMENIYIQKDKMGANLIPSLQNIAQRHLSFSNYHQTTGTYWSMASVVAGSCGVALNLFGRNNSVVSQEYFLPYITCLQDIMADNGYEMMFIKGGDAKFAGLNLFLKNRAHGHIHLYDAGYFEKHFENWKGDDWGAKDRLMYENAKQKIISLAEQKKPFFATVFTLDLHLMGYLDKQCSSQFWDYRDIVMCADQMAADFVDWFEKQDFAKNTVLIVMGDHLAMGNDIYTQYLAPYDDERTIYMTILNSQIQPESTSQSFTALDLFPSILESIGVQIDGHCLGMGCSIFSNKSNLYQTETPEGLKKKLSQPSSLYRHFIFGY